MHNESNSNKIPIAHIPIHTHTHTHTHANKFFPRRIENKRAYPRLIRKPHRKKFELGANAVTVRKVSLDIWTLRPSLNQRREPEESVRAAQGQTFDIYG